ncbi:MAG: TlpA family protein disulfide reductase [Proteobacteria bacterium]|nr:TlpA family protein disulfide reductase [Pseudomonadota bacterium]
MMMKKTTRNYLHILLANVLLVAFIAVVWQVRLEAAPPVKPVLHGVFEHVKLEKTPKSLPKATYLEGLEKSVPLESLKGKWTILNLWATWCTPCVAELPSLQQLADEYADKDLRIVAVSVDNAETVDELKAMIARVKLSKIKIAQNWDDKAEISDNLWPEAVPTTYLITPQGKVFATFEGDADWTSPEARAFVDSLLGTTQKSQ